jgi:hypothetical protein
LLLNLEKEKFYNLIPQQKQMITKIAVGTNKSACKNKRTVGRRCTRQEEMALGVQWWH